MDMLSRAKQKQKIYIGLGLVLLVFHQIVPQQKKGEVEKKIFECLTTFISHMMGVITDRAEQNVLFSQKVTENIPPGQRTSPITNVHRSLPVMLPAVVCLI